MSSHREAPEISKDPVADSTDLYAFVSPDKPDTRHDHRQLRAAAGARRPARTSSSSATTCSTRSTSRHRGDAHADITLQLPLHDRRGQPGDLPLQHRSDHVLGQPDLQPAPDLLGHQGRRRGKKAVLGEPPAVPAVQHRTALDTELRPPRQAGRAHAPGRRQGLRRAARRRLLRRPRLGVRPARPAAVPEPAPDPGRHRRPA